MVQQPHDLPGQAVRLVGLVGLRPPLQDEGPGPGQAQLGGEKEAGGTAADDDDVERQGRLLRIRVCI
ncbi:hypothetical protein GCM10020001_100360 [Nonomuraea salmonea]